MPLFTPTSTHPSLKCVLAHMLQDPLLAVRVHQQRDAAAVFASSSRALYPVSREETLRLQAQLDSSIPTGLLLAKQQAHQQQWQCKWKQQQQQHWQHIPQPLGAQAGGGLVGVEQFGGQSLQGGLGVGASAAAAKAAARAGSPMASRGLKQQHAESGAHGSSSNSSSSTGLGLPVGLGGSPGCGMPEPLCPSLPVDFKALDRLLQQAAEQVGGVCEFQARTVSELGSGLREARGIFVGRRLFNCHTDNTSILNLAAGRRR